MDTRYYQAEGLDVERLATDLEHMFLSQGYQVQHFGNSDHMTVQMKKGGDFIAIFGLQTALTVTMQRAPGGVLALVGQQKTPPWRRWAPWTAPGTPSNTVVCPNCQAVNDAADRYCMRCGQALASQKALCPNCGAETRPDAAFCTKCGTPLSQPAQ